MNNPTAAIHPQKNDKGQDVIIHAPHTADGEKTFVPGGATPTHINGVALTKATDPHSGLDLSKSDDHTFRVDPHKRVAAGMIVVEPDHRVWIVSPTNKFGGYSHTFPKGGHDADSPSLKHTATKEMWEESGIKAQPTHHLGDYDRLSSKTRFYVGKRVGGSPADMGWESQATHLVHVDDLHHYLHSDADHQILSDLKSHLRRQLVVDKMKNIFNK